MKPTDDFVVCVCRQVSQDQIHAAIKAGADNLPAVRAACGASTECGTCTDDIREMLAETGQ